MVNSKHSLTINWADVQINLLWSQQLFSTHFWGSTEWGGVQRAIPPATPTLPFKSASGYNHKSHEQNTSDGKKFPRILSV